MILQVMKCADPEDCWYCTLCPPRIPEEEFKNLHFLPDSVFNKAENCYRPFEEVYGKRTNDDDRPSLQNKNAWSTDTDKDHKALLVAGM
jgi:hypothetical protein